MNITHLKLTNVRVIESAEVYLRPGFNLVVGVNGVGKTTILEALAVSLSGILKRINKIRMRTESFSADAIRLGADSMYIDCGFQIAEIEDSYLIHRTRETNVPQKKEGLPREQVHVTPAKEGFAGKSLEILQKIVQSRVGAKPPSSKSSSPLSVGNDESGSVDDMRVTRPIAILYSTNRAVPSERKPSVVSAAGGVAAAFADAFSYRELRLAEFAAWMRAQQTICKERPSMERNLEALEGMVTLFLPDYKNLRLGGQNDHILLIDRSTATLPVRHLSDGERGLLALVLDLTLRLSQANPELEDPAMEAEAVVLIDEIDLHLHPKWQRQIVHKLTAAFPKCQFIATTHSPQIIGEVESDRIHIIADGQIYSPTHSFGVDSSRVLEEIMEADPRTRKVHELLTSVGHEIDDDKFEQARCSLSSLIEILGENDPEVIRLRTLLDFMEEKG